MAHAKKCLKCGEYTYFMKPDCYECWYVDCRGQLVEVALTEDECEILLHVSTNMDFIDAMNKLKEDNIIEFELKMLQFRNQVEQKSSKTEDTQKSTGPVCPKCGSTEFTPVRRKWRLMTGIFTNKVDLICNKCGTKVKTQ